MFELQEFLLILSRFSLFENDSANGTALKSIFKSDQCARALQIKRKHKDRIKAVIGKSDFKISQMDSKSALILGKFLKNP